MLKKSILRFFKRHEREENPPLFADLTNPKLTTNQRTWRFRGSYNRRRGLPFYIPFEGYHDYSQDEIEELIHKPFHKILSSQGFQRSSKKLWVRRDLAPICHIFSLEPLGKTAWQYAPAYGISLDFVPHISSGSLKWHRTVKSARYDLNFRTASRWLNIHAHAPENQLVADVNFALPRTLKMAQQCWENATTLDQVKGTFARYGSYERRKLPQKWEESERFLGLDFQLNSPARAFLAAKLGNVQQANEIYDDWVEKQNRLNDNPFDPGLDETLRSLMAQLQP